MLTYLEGRVEGVDEGGGHVPVALVEQLVPNTVANLLVRLMEQRKRGEEEEKHIKDHFTISNFVLCTFHDSTVQHPISTYLVHNSFVVTLLDTV